MQAIAAGLFRNGTESERMRHVLLTALDIANALAYLHSVGIIHADLKAGNVLLKNASTDQKGFMCKVSDFGEW